MLSTRNPLRILLWGTDGWVSCICHVSLCNASLLPSIHTVWWSDFIGHPYINTFSMFMIYELYQPTLMMFMNFECNSDVIQLWIRSIFTELIRMKCSSADTGTFHFEKPPSVKWACAIVCMSTYQNRGTEVSLYLNCTVCSSQPQPQSPKVSYLYLVEASSLR